MGSAISNPDSSPQWSRDGVGKGKQQEEIVDDSNIVRRNLIFPNEVLEKIVSFLSTRDKLVAREVCLDWMNYINNAAGLQELVKIKICSDELSYLMNSPLDPVFNSFYFHKVDITRQSMMFWLLYSDFITHLDFYDCSVIPRNTVDSRQPEFILGCPNLQHLSLVNCDKYFLMGGKFIQLHEILCLDNLVTLNLSRNKNLTDSILFSILLKTKRLESLNLSDCINMVFMRAVHNRFYPSNSVRPPYSDNVLSFHTLCQDFLHTERARHMKQFNFGMKLNSTGIQILTSCDDIQWECANLESPELKSSDLIHFMSEFHTSLVKLYLGRCKLSNEDIFSTDLFKLEEFSAHDSRNLENLSFLHTMPRLRSLTLDGANGFDLSSEVMNNLHNLTSLSLNGIKPNGTPEACRAELISCLRKLRNLRSLDLGNCSLIVNDSVSREIILNLRKLRRLNLEATNISDFGLVGVKENAEVIKSSSTKIVFNHETMSENMLVFSLSDLTDLEYLNLSHCRDLGEFTWQFGINLPNLVSLNLSSCPTLSKRGILSIINKCRNIETFVLVHCSLQILSDPEVLSAARETLYRCHAITY